MISILFFILFYHRQHTSTFQLLDKPWSQVCRPFPPPPGSLPPIFIAHRVQQSHSSSIFHRVLPTHALALPASKSMVHKTKPPQTYTSICTRSGGVELTKLTYYVRLEDNLIRHRGDRRMSYMLLGSDSS